MTRPLRPSERHTMLWCGDALAVTLAVGLALWTWSLTAGYRFGFTFLRAHLLWLTAIPLWLLLLIPTREVRTVFDARRSGIAVMRAAVALLTAYFGVFFFIGMDRLPRLVALYVMWDVTLLVIAWRLTSQWWFTRAPFARRILIAGAGRPISVALDLLRDPSFRDADLIGLVGSRDAVVHSAVPYLGALDDIDLIAERLAVTEIVLAVSGDVDATTLRRLLRCQEHGASVVRMAQLYERVRGRVPVEYVEPSWLLTNFLDVARYREVSPLAKRLIDVVAASILALGGLLVTPAIIVAMLIEDRGEILYRQTRVGRGGKIFVIAKFRTMRVDAERDGLAQWSTPGDPRITRVGRFLRRTRLDELPNLFSVLRGDMSMVGPRPERPEFVAQLEREVPLYRARLIVAPGLTGWAQVSWPYGDSVEHAVAKLEFDLYYVKYQSIWFDVMILLRTIRTMVRLGGR